MKFQVIKTGDKTFLGDQNYCKIIAKLLQNYCKIIAKLLQN